MHSVSTEITSRDQGGIVLDQQASGVLVKDPNDDPPPDLVIEVATWRTSLDRLGILAALGVPEVWRWEHESLKFYSLDSGRYHVSHNSRAFPTLTAVDIEPFVRLDSQIVDQNTIIRQLRAWVRQHHGLP